MFCLQLYTVLLVLYVIVFGIRKQCINVFISLIDFMYTFIIIYCLSALYIRLLNPIISYITTLLTIYF